MLGEEEIAGCGEWMGEEEKKGPTEGRKQSKHERGSEKQIWWMNSILIRGGAEKEREREEEE